MCVLGTCMHFVLDAITAPAAVKVLGNIFPVNETSWEHMKMFWYPFLVAGIIVSIRQKDKGYIGGFVISGFVAMFLQLGLFAFYESFTGTSVLIFDIIFYMLDMICCIGLALYLAKNEFIKKTWIIWVIAAVVITAVLIIYLTYHPGAGYVFLDDTMLE